MENLEFKNIDILKFIFDKPEVVVNLLKKNNYTIDMDTATIPEIEALTFNVLNGKDEKFTKELFDLIRVDSLLKIAK